MRVVLGEAPGPGEALDHAGLLVAVDRAELEQAQRQLAVGTAARREDQVVHRAVHRLEVVVRALPTDHALGVDVRVELHRGVHALRVPVEVSGLLEQRALRDVGAVDELVAAGLVRLARVVLHHPADDAALRVEDGKPGSDLLGEGEQVQLGAELAVIALLRLLQERQVRAQRVLRRPCGAVDALQLLVLLVAQPVGGGRSHELDRVRGDVARVGDVRAATEVAPAALPRLRIEVVVDGQLGAADLHDVSPALAADQAQLEGLVRELVDGIALGHHTSGEPLPGLQDHDHALLEVGEIVRGEGGLDAEVVVEAVLDGRPDAELRVREGVLHGLRQHVRGGVPQHREALGRIGADRLDDVGLGDGGGQVLQLAVDAGDDDGPVAAHQVEGGCGHRASPCRDAAATAAQR